MTKKTKKRNYSFDKRKYLKDVKKRGLWAANIKLLKKRKKTRRRKKLLKKKLKL